MLAYFRPIAASLISLLLLSSSVQAGSRLFPLGEIDQHQGAATAFHSFQNQALVVALAHKETSANACKENQYFYYDYKNEIFHSFVSADLLISRDFKFAVSAEPLTLKAITKTELESFGKRLEKIAEELKAPSSLLEETGVMRADGLARCWLRPTITNLETGESKSYPFILANPCSQGICTKLEWSNDNQAMLWVRLKSGLFHQVKINPATGTYAFAGQKKPFVINRKTQENAYRANIVEGHMGRFALSKTRKNQSWLEWETNQSNISTSLARTGVEVKKAQEMAEEIKILNQQKQWEKAKAMAAFGLWVDPDSESLHYQALMTKALSGDLKTFFAELRNHYNYKNRVATCRQLHLDPAIQPLWAQAEFIESFKATCP